MGFLYFSVIKAHTIKSFGVRRNLFEPCVCTELRVRSALLLGVTALCSVQCMSLLVTKFCDFNRNVIYFELSGFKDIVTVICSTNDVNYIELYMSGTYIHSHIYTYINT